MYQIHKYHTEIGFLDNTLGFCPCYCFYTIKYDSSHIVFTKKVKTKAKINSSVSHENITPQFVEYFFCMFQCLPRAAILNIIKSPQNISKSSLNSISMINEFTSAILLNRTRNGKHTLSSSLPLCITLPNQIFFRMMYYSVLTQTQTRKKEIPSAPIRSRTKDLPITSSDALPLSYRRLVGAKAIKLCSWHKHPAYC